MDDLIVCSLILSGLAKEVIESFLLKALNRLICINFILKLK